VVAAVIVTATITTTDNWEFILHNTLLELYAQKLIEKFLHTIVKWCVSSLPAILGKSIVFEKLLLINSSSK
jgi:hypothetical protein